MAVIADDFALLGHHAVAALGTGVEKLLGLAHVGSLFHLAAEIHERGKFSDDRHVVLQVFIHTTSLARPFRGLNGLICRLIKG